MIEKNREKKLVIISLGAGVQSSTMALMAAKGDDAYWHFMKTERVAEFADAVEFDKKIRTGSTRILEDEDNIYITDHAYL
jgi:hypothetical protein